MAINFAVFLLLAFMSSFKTTLNAEIISRKGLRSKVVDQEPYIQFKHPVRTDRVDPSRVIELSWQPRAFLYRSFLSDEECDQLISQNLAGKGNGSEEQDTRKERRNFEVSTNIEDNIAARIEERISAWTFLPKENATPLQILHFEDEDAKQKYDFFGNNSSLALGEPLTASVILYLSDVSQGGQILFPESRMKNSRAKNKVSLTDCTKSGNVLRPTKGNAVLFFNTHPNTTPDKSSAHERCPVVEGDMWCATKFFHLRSISVSGGKARVQSEESGGCTDEDENCPRWAALGECQKNAVFMVGSPDYYGTCRKSCNVCSS